MDPHCLFLSTLLVLSFISQHSPPHALAICLYLCVCFSFSSIFPLQYLSYPHHISGGLGCFVSLLTVFFLSLSLAFCLANFISLKTEVTFLKIFHRYPVSPSSSHAVEFTVDYLFFGAVLKILSCL